MSFIQSLYSIVVTHITITSRDWQQLQQCLLTILKAYLYTLHCTDLRLDN